MIDIQELKKRQLEKLKRMKEGARKLDYTKGDDGKYYIKLNPRTLIQAPEGYVLVSADYASQELRIAAAVSGDPVMLKSFLDDCPEAPDKIPVPEDYDGEYKNHEALGKNPEKDLHTMTAHASFGQYFINRPKYEWCCISREIKVNGTAIRKWAKFISFGTIYMQSAQTMSDLHKVPVKETKQWIKGFNDKYKVFYEWQQTQAQLGAARGWTRDGLGRWRWCNESNSKGKDNSGDRLAVNHLIQGLAAGQTKLACNTLLDELANTKARIVGIIHDEILVEVPGKWKFRDDAYDELGRLVNYTCVEVDDEVKHYMNVIVDCMEEAQTYTFNKINPNLGIKGKAEAAAAPFWLH